MGTRGCRDEVMYEFCKVDVAKFLEASVRERGRTFFRTPEESHCLTLLTV